MTEEIINGVDVTGCRHLKNDGIKKPICRSGGCIGVYNSCLCEDNIDCDYKQLKRLEQENRELQAYKDINEDFKKAWDELNEKYKQLRSELEEILESAKFAQCLPCGSGNLEDCLNCNDDTTNNGQFCMEKRIHDIKTKCVEVLRVLNDSEC